jgi:4-hydroxy-2-oxoheptanedioate aldolase
MLPGTNLTRVMCRSATNMDWLLVDLEHGNISDDSMHEIIATAAACGVPPCAGRGGTTLNDQTPT